MNKSLQEAEIRQSRRNAIKTLGMGAIAVMGATAANAEGMGLKNVLREGRITAKNLPKSLQVNPEVLELKLADPRAMKALNLTKRLPEDTPILKMGLDKKFAQILTDNARELRKGDLEALAAGKNTSLTKRLTVEDIKSVQVAFGGGYNVTNLALDVSCCCCTPCCCAAALPLEKAAA